MVSQLYPVPCSNMSVRFSNENRCEERILGCQGHNETFIQTPELHLKCKLPYRLELFELSLNSIG